MIRLHNLSKWEKLGDGKVLEFSGENSRRVRVEVNTETDTRLDIVHGDKVTFLAVVKGYEVLEFVAEGGTALAAVSDGEVWFFTNEGDHIETDRRQTSFTKIMQRRARNPELERIAWKMEQNVNRRMAAMEAEYSARLAAFEAGTGAHPDTGELPEEMEASADEADSVGSGDSEQPPA